MMLSDLIKKWRRSRMQYYFILSLVLFSVLIFMNVVFMYRYF